MIERLSVKPLFIEPGSPWESEYVESFNGKMRDELLNHEIFDTLQEAQILIARWGGKYNHFSPQVRPDMVCHPTSLATAYNHTVGTNINIDTKTGADQLYSAENHAAWKK